MKTLPTPVYMKLSRKSDFMGAISRLAGGFCDANFFFR